MGESCPGSVSPLQVLVGCVIYRGPLTDWAILQQLSKHFGGAHDLSSTDEVVEELP